MKLGTLPMMKMMMMMVQRLANGGIGADRDLYQDIGLGLLVQVVAVCSSIRICWVWLIVEMGMIHCKIWSLEVNLENTLFTTKLRVKFDSFD